MNRAVCVRKPGPTAEVAIKKTAPKNLATIGKISGLVIQAAKEIGKDKLYDHEKEIIIKQLKREEPYRLEHDIKLAPEWIRIIMRQALKNSDNEMSITE